MVIDWQGKSSDILAQRAWYSNGCWTGDQLAGWNVYQLAGRELQSIDWTRVANN